MDHPRLSSAYPGVADEYPKPRENGMSERMWFLAIVSAIIVMALLASQRSTPKVAELTIEEGRLARDAGALIVDVRHAEAFDFRHIPGAINIPLSVLQVSIPATLEQAKDRRIVVYCNDGVRTGPKATAILNRNGFANAANLTHGVEGWDKAGLPLKRQP